MLFPRLARIRSVSLGLLMALVGSACGGEVLSAGTGAPGPGGTEPGASAPSPALATFDGQIEAITMDATDVYLSTSDSIYRIARDGSAPPVVIGPTLTSFAWAMVVDETNVYWAALESGINGGAIFSLPKRGGGMPVLVASKQLRPSDLAVDDTHVYWTNQGNASGQDEGGGAVMSAPKAGGPAKVLVDDLPMADAIALDGDGVVWKDHYTIRRIPKAGGPITTIDSRIERWGVNGLVVVKGRVFYPAWDGFLWSAPTNGSAPPVVLTGVPMAARIAVHGEVVFFNGPWESYGSILSVSVNGGAQSTVVPAQKRSGDLTSSAYRVLVDDRAIYWTDYWANRANGMHTAVRAADR